MKHDPGELAAYDVRCVCCDNTNGTGGDAVHVVWLPADHESGDSIGYAHIDKPGACGEYSEHVIVAELPNITHPGMRVDGVA